MIGEDPPSLLIALILGAADELSETRKASKTNRASERI